MKEYDHKKIEKKWQAVWEKKKIYQAKDFSKKPKFYSLIEFPYPSGAGLHVGHIRSNTAMDIISRKRRMEGFNVLYPIGWDAFGLPTENYAIKTGIQPALVTKKNTNIFRKQLKEIGFSFDWSREINTTDPKYYKWTQWIFLQFLKKGLAYKAKIMINWCPKDKIGLANEEVIGGCCERCGTPVEKREKEQWMLAITKYADRLDKDLDMVGYLPQIKLAQRNWIGRSEGAEIEFKMSRFNLDINVFTTRPDTIFGATYLVLAPEHPLITNLKLRITNWGEVEKYIKTVKKKTDIERTNEDKIKTGVELKGIKAINPANKEEISIWIADYVLATYGTGAIMAVPAHDERDFEFAKKYKLEIKQVVQPKSVINIFRNAEDLAMGVQSEFRIKGDCYTGDGILVNSDKFSGQDSEKAKKEIIKFVGGKEKTIFKLRDWVFSRQRYWGEPIPVVFCKNCQLRGPASQYERQDLSVNAGWVPVPEKDLPVVLPKVKNYQPTESGESPLANIVKWVNVKCPKCKGKAKRETDTMPNWAGSSWYYLRYTDPKNKKEFASPKNLKYWTPVDWYNGGNEHTTLHLLYSRFWHKFLFDLKLVPTPEPYKKRTSHGMILGEGGVKMSKSIGNVINPDDIVKTYGADTLRIYEMFMGPFSQSVAWSEEAIIGPRRFLERVWNLQYKIQKNKKYNEFEIEKTIKKVTGDIEEMKFNTAISTLMIFINEVGKLEFISQKAYEKFLQILSPFAPHITEEIWFNLGHKDSIHLSSWPKWDKNLIQDEEMKIVVQINGKVRAEIMIQNDDNEETVKQKALANEAVLKHLAGKNVKKVFYVKNKLINIVL